MPDPDRAHEISGGLIIDEAAGVFAGPLAPDYAALDGSLHISPGGLYQRVGGAWQGGGAVGQIYPRQIATATLEAVQDGELVGEKRLQQGSSYGGRAESCSGLNWPLRNLRLAGLILAILIIRFG